MTAIDINDIKYNSGAFSKVVKGDDNTLVYVAPSGKQVIVDYDTEQERDEAFEAAEIGAGGGLVQIDTYSELPTSGSKGSIYITKDTGQEYYWDDATENYVTVGTAGRTGVYSTSEDLPVTIGQTKTINKTDLAEIVAPTVDYSEGSEVIGANATHGLIVSSTNSAVTVKTVMDATIDSFKQVASESSLPQIGQENVLYYLQDTDKFRVWDATAQDYVEPASGGVIPYFDSPDFGGSTDIGNKVSKPLDFSELKMGLNLVQVNQSKSSFYYKYNWNGTEKTGSTTGIKDFFTNDYIYWKLAVITLYVDPSDFSVYTNSYQPLGDIKFISMSNSCTQYFITVNPSVQLVYLNHSQTYVLANEANTALNNKQDTLVSGTNIKTINNESLLGAGNINVPSSTPTFIISTSLNTDKGSTNQNAIDFDTLPVGTTIFKNYLQSSSFYGTITCDATSKSLGFSSMTYSYKIIGSSSVFFNQVEIEKYVDFTDAADLTDGTYIAKITLKYFDEAGNKQVTHKQYAASTVYYVIKDSFNSSSGVRATVSTRKSTEAISVTVIDNALDSLTTNKENISNKVTSLSSSSTDTQYPSAKAVYDAIYGALNDDY